MRDRRVSFRRLFRTVAAVATATGLAFPSIAQVSSREAERLRLLTGRLVSHLEGREVRLPDGTRVPLIGTVLDGTGETALLTPHRLRQCLETVDEAEAWPATWLVVQDRSRSFDVAMLLRLGTDGYVASPEIVFATWRLEWDHAVLDSAVRVATGRKAPRQGRNNLVIQSFSRRTINEYVYVPAEGSDGLRAILPEGSMIREARSVELSDGMRHTIALVLVGPRFLPSDCVTCRDRSYGHSDTGRVLLVLAGETGIVDTLDLTAMLAGSGIRPMVPRYRCENGDTDLAARPSEVNDRFGARELLPLLTLEDLDGDGFAGEVALDGEMLGCERRVSVIAGVAPAEARLVVIGTD